MELFNLCGVMLDAVLRWVLIQRIVDVLTVCYTIWNYGVVYWLELVPTSTTHRQHIKYTLD